MVSKGHLSWNDEKTFIMPTGVEFDKDCLPWKTDILTSWSRFYVFLQVLQVLVLLCLVLREMPLYCVTSIGEELVKHIEFGLTLKQTKNKN